MELSPRESLAPFRSLRDQFDRWMEEALRSLRADGGPWQPAVDLYETDQEVVVTAEVPGMSPDDLVVEVNDTSILLRGELQKDEREQRGGYVRAERRVGTFLRSIPLPAEVDGEQARATYRHGVLEVRAPKRAGARRRRLAIELDGAEANR